MIRPVVNVPFAMMRMTTVKPYIDWRGQSESERTGGGTQIVFNQFPRWMYDVNFLFDREVAPYWAALQAQVQGRVGIYRLFVYDPQVFNPRHLMPADALDLDNAFGVQPYGGPAFDFDSPPQITAAADAAAGATSISVTISNSELVPKTGQIISADDWPMRVTSVTATDVSTYTLGVSLQRATITSGDPINLIATGKFEAMTDTDGAGEYGIDLTTRTPMTFREVLNR